MAADRIPDFDLPPDDAPTAGPSPLQVILRRWPLLAVGLAAGVVLGVLIHLASTPLYRSSAQVLVVKKQQSATSSSDTRLAVVEDYVATQLTLIKSEKIRRAAARNLKDDQLDPPLPADELVAANMLAAGLSVTREKDAGSGSQIGSGSGNTEIVYVVRDNLTGSGRQGIITAGGKPFTITQDGGQTSGCQYSLSPTFASVPASGANGSVNVTAQAGCAWQSESNASWIIITSNCCGVGNGSINYTVEVNRTGNSRNGTIIIGGRSFSIKQPAN